FYSHVAVLLFFFFSFFFSSRRRHTRSKRDWSSDVCSSDLNLLMLCFKFSRWFSKSCMCCFLLDKPASRVSIAASIFSALSSDDINISKASCLCWASFKHMKKSSSSSCHFFLLRKIKLLKDFF